MNKQVTGERKQREGYKEKVENSVAHVSQLESIVSMYNKLFRYAWLTCAHATCVCHELPDVTYCCHNGCGNP